MALCEEDVNTMLGSVVTGGIVRGGIKHNAGFCRNRQFLNPGAVDGIVRSVDSHKHL